MEEKQPRVLSKYLEFGVRTHFDDVLQITSGVLLVYLPFALVALYIHPPIRAFINPGAQTMSLIPRMLISQVLLRVLQAFIFILLILRVESNRKGDGSVWDLEGAMACFVRVVSIDLAYAFGLQLLGVAIFGGTLVLTGLLMGNHPLSLPLAFSLTAFIVMVPAVRFYFCSLTALLYGDGFIDSFRRAGIISSGGERIVVLMVMTYVLIWFFLWQFVQGIFGPGFFGQIILQAGVMLTSISYFFAGYSLFSDLTADASQKMDDMHALEAPDGEDSEDGHQEDPPGVNR